MKQFFTSTLLIATLSISISFAQNNEELKKIKDNYTRYILFEDRNQLDNILISLQKESIFADRMVVELMERYPVDVKYINKLIAELKDDNSWEDIDYKSQHPSGWPPKEHIERILLLAKAYRIKGTPLYNSDQVINTIHRAFKFWVDKKLICVNWWHNEIGIPRTLGEAILLIESELSSEEKAQAIEIISKAKIKMTGQNKVWLSGNVLIRAILQDDIELAKEARNSILAEATDGHAEGIKPDNSFHQHGPQQQFGNYGAAYVSSMSFWAQTFSGTSLAFDQKNLDIIARVMTEGYRRVLWKGYLDINGLGRQFFKQAQTHKGLTVGFAAYGLAKVDSKNREKYLEFIKDNFSTSTEGTTKTGVYHFWQSDQTVQRRPQWMASVKMYSSRVIGTESGNGDNMKGYYLADGALYTYVDGDEYHDIYPCWNWRLIPGITSYVSNAPIKVGNWANGRGKLDFVGNVNNGKTGITAMDFERDGLAARKAWIFTEDYVLCLGAGISTDENVQVRTSIDQVNKKADILILESGKWIECEDKKWEIEKNEMRLFHNKKGYIIPKNTSTEPHKVLNSKDNEAKSIQSLGSMTANSRRGSWHDIMQIYPIEDEVAKDVVTIAIFHGDKPKDETYQYIILPSSTPDITQNFDLKQIKTISNTKELQAVEITKIKTVYISAYAPVVKTKLNGKTTFSCSAPGLFMIENYKTLYVSDPTQKLEQMTVTINKKDYVVKLPQGDLRGTSVKINI